jgi:hypothetical protein
MTLILGLSLAHAIEALVTTTLFWLLIIALSARDGWKIRIRRVAALVSMVPVSIRKNHPPNSRPQMNAGADRSIQDYSHIDDILLNLVVSPFDANGNI